MKRMLLPLLLILLAPPCCLAAETLDIYVIDTEGGKAMLVVAPSGQSLLVDAGFPGYNDRDAIRIEEVAKAAGVSKLDFLVVTHYDLDHVNNAPATVKRIPTRVFMDHGRPAVRDKATAAAFNAYLDLASQAKRIVLEPGDKIPLKGVEIRVVASAGEAIKSPLKHAGALNPFCMGVEPRAEPNVSENAHSLGLHYRFGKFSMLDLADLTWNEELELMCPKNPIGSVDLLMVNHHGCDESNSPALIHGVGPKVAIMNNGPDKGGAPAVLRTLRSSPGLEAAYQLHWSGNAPDDNPPDEFIANLRDSKDGAWIKVSAERDGRFTVANGRTGVSKTFDGSK